MRDRELPRLRRLELEHRDVRQRIGADELGRDLFPRRQRAEDRLGLAGDVVVGDHVPLGRDDGAAARRLALQLAAVLVVDRHDVDADQAGGDFGQRGVDGCGVGGAPRPRRRASLRAGSAGASRLNRSSKIGRRIRASYASFDGRSNPD